VVAITKMALGGIAEYAIADGVSVFAAPPDFDDAEAAAFLLPFQTSHLALFRRGRLRAGQTIVVHSAASGLGTAGIQLAKAAGATVIAVAGGSEKTARCAALGADLVIDHMAEDFVEVVLAATGDAGADVIYDLAGGDFAERSWRCTAHGGRYLAVGFADDDNNGMTGRPLRMACIGNIDIVGVMLAWVTAVDPGMRRFGFNPFGRDVADEIHADLLRLAAEGKIRPVIGRRVAMHEAGQALDVHEARRGVHLAGLRAAQPAAAGIQRDRGRAEPARARAARPHARVRASRRGEGGRA
jgi:NADPH2:quinone reductase